MTKQKTKQSVQSDGSDGEKMSETIENFLTTIYGRELDGNELRSALAIIEQEKAKANETEDDWKDIGSFKVMGLLPSI